MAKEQKRLGRGLSALISSDFTQPRQSTIPPREPALPAGPATGSPGNLRADDKPQLRVPINKVKRNPYQPREMFNERSMADLVQSIRRSGILQPLIVRPAKDGWELIAGERRLRAAIQAGLDDVPVVVYDATNEQVLELALIENIHREDLNAIERATAYRRYAEEFKLPVEEIAKRVGEDRSTVANYLRLLELSEDIRHLVAESVITMGHARSLLGIANTQERWELAMAIVENELSVRALEDIVRRRKQRPMEAGLLERKPEARPLVRAIQEELTGSLGLKVIIRERRKPNTGEIIIHYSSLDDFNRITEALGLKAR